MKERKKTKRKKKTHKNHNFGIQTIIVKTTMHEFTLTFIKQQQQRQKLNQK